MATQRQVDAYRRRLAKISAQDSPGHHLTAECLQAVVTFHALWPHESEDGQQGTLVGFGYRIGQGLFGPRLMVDITVCDDCVHRKGQCGPDHEQHFEDVVITAIVRNGDGQAVA